MRATAIINRAIRTRITRRGKATTTNTVPTPKKDTIKEVMDTTMNRMYPQLEFAQLEH